MMIQKLILPFVLSLCAMQAWSQSEESARDKKNATEPSELAPLPDSTGTASDTLLAEALLAKVQVEMMNGAFKSSSELALRAMEIYEKHLGPDNEKTVSASIWLASCLLSERKFEKAVMLSEAGLAWYEKNGRMNHENAARALLTIGYCYIYAGNFGEAKIYLDRTRNHLANHHPESHILWPSFLNAIAWFENSQGRFPNAINSLQKVLNLLEQYHPHHKVTIATAHTSLAGAYEGVMDLGKTILHYDIAISMFSSFTNSDSLKMALVYNNYGNSLNSFGQWEQAEKLLLTALQYLPANTPLTGNVKYGLGISYIGQKKYEKAITSLKDCKNVWLPVFGNIHPAIASVWAYLAYAEAGRRNYKDAVSLLQNALDILDKTSGKHYPDLAGYQLDMVAYKTALGDIPGAKDWLEKAFSTLKYENGDATFYDNPVSPNLLANAFYQKAKLYIREGGFDNISAALVHLDRSLRIFEFLKGRVAESTSKQFLTEKVFPAYEAAIACNFELQKLDTTTDYKENAFRLFERSKAAQLLAATREAGYFNFAGLPDSVLEREIAWRSDIAFLEKSKAETLSLLPTDDDAMFEIIDKLLKAKTAYEALISDIEKNYPAYYKLKYDNATISLSEVQNNLLEPDEALLEYFVGDSSIFVFVINKDKEPHFVELKKNFPLEEWVAKLRESLTNTDLTQAYISYGQKLYDTLVKPVKHWLPERVIVVPDGVLGFVPFEVLLDTFPADSRNFKTYPFLIKKHQFSYCYSATMLLEMQQKQHSRQAVKNFIAFAPDYEGTTEKKANRQPGRDTGLSPLIFAKEEVKTIARLMGSKDVFTGKEAGKDVFLKIAGDFRIIHLAMHALADNRAGDYAFLAFSNPIESFEKLYVRELYNLSLNADLVVLSACETGAGQLSRGEGIISIARAFSYAGAKSIITTLWSVNDQSTAQVMGCFYKYLLEGRVKDNAIRQAQLDYLNQTGGLNQNLHPYFWAAFVPAGDMQPFDKTKISGDR